MDDKQAGMGINFSHAQGPDGKLWVAITIGIGPMSITFGMPTEAVESFINELQSCGDNARRANLGLIVNPTMNGVKN